MSHTVHTTHALVLGSAEVQDADKLFWLLTEDLGLLFASAKSIREETSKLRYALQDLAQPRVSLVRGRGLWRLTGAEEHEAQPLVGKDAQAFGRIAALVRRLVPTDEENTQMYMVVRNARDELIQNQNEKELVEQITVGRILHQLGYLSCTEPYRGIIDVMHFDNDVLTRGSALQQQLIHDINTGIAESQL